jgi:cobalt-zinc-cadmium efflux system outer membrane protein
MKQILLYTGWGGFLLIGMVMGAPRWVQGQETLGVCDKLTLVEAIRVALEHNPRVDKAASRVDAALGRARQASRWSNPELELNAEEWPVSNGGSFSDAKQTIGIAQTLPFPRKKSLDRRIGDADVDRSGAEVALRRTELVRDVKAAFYSVLVAERLVAVSQELVTVAEASATTAQKRVEAGAAPLQEQLRAEVQFEKARAAWMERERELAASRTWFGTMLGQPALGESPLAAVLTDTADPAMTATRVHSTLTNHPSFLGAQANLDQARLREQRARLEPYPDVRVSVAGGRKGETEESIIELGFAVPLPLLDTGKGRRDEAKADIRGAEAELEATRQALQRELANALRRYETAVQQVGNYRDRLLPRAEEALTLVQTGFEEGKFDFMDLLDTQRTTAEARQAYQRRILEMKLAHAELEALLKPEPLDLSTAP